MDPGSDAGPVEPVRCLLLDDPDPDVVELTSRPGVISVDVVDHERIHLLAERSMPAVAPTWSALVWTALWTAAGPAHDDVTTTLHVDRHPVWGDHLDDPGDALLMVSLVASLPGMEAADFAGRYRAHAEVARTHHGFDAYRQNVVTSRSGHLADGTAAVSEILLATEDAWRNSFYATPSSAEIVGNDVTRFLDRTGTSSTLVRRFPGTA